MMNHADSIPRCPICSHEMVVTQLECPECESKVVGKLSLPMLARLPKDLQDVVVVFLQCRGNFREVERELGISYPTVSKKLDTINLFLEAMVSEEDSPRARILRQLDAGELAFKEAVALLKKQETA